MSMPQIAMSQKEDAVKRLRTFLKIVKSAPTVTPQLVSRAQNVLNDTLKAGVKPNDPDVLELKEWISNNQPA